MSLQNGEEIDHFVLDDYEIHPDVPELNNESRHQCTLTEGGKIVAVRTDTHL